MAREANAALQAKILQIGFVVIFVAAVLYAVRGMMFGSKANAGLIAFSFIGLGSALLLDDKYWLMFPFLASSGLTLPNLPFSGIELGCLVLFVVYFFRLALRREQPFRLDRDLLVVFPVLLWMFFIWIMNPVGLAMFGSSTIGGRFYFDIAVGTMGLFVLSTIRVSERSSRLLFFAILFAQCWALVRGVVFPSADPDAIVFVGAEPDVSTRYAFVVCASIFALLFSYWSLSSILSSFSRIFLLSVLSFLVVYSGKRRAFGTIALVPFFRVLLTGRERMITFVTAVFGCVFLAVAVAADGIAYELPQSARRALAVVVPRYQTSRGDGGINDVFRREMREQARYVIKTNPWFGRKGFAMDLNETAWIHFGGGYTSQFAGHAYSGNWHSAWYAYAADFGIPCMILWFLFFAYVLWYAYRAPRIVTAGRFLSTCCLYYSFHLFISAVFSYTSGHSASTTMDTFLSYGMLLAIVRGFRYHNGSVT